jgi:hypothetical protein
MGVFGKFVFAQVFSRGSFQMRIEYWNIALNVIRDFPLFGVGPDKLYDVSSNYMAPGTLKIITTTRLDNAHNWYLNFGVNFGLISLIILLVIFGWVFFASARLLKNLAPGNAIPLSCMVAFLSMFIDGLVSLEQPGIGVWLYLFAGVVVGASLQSQENIVGQNSISKSTSSLSIPLLKVGAFSLSTILFLSSMLTLNRIVYDGILRSNVQKALLNEGSPQTFSAIEFAAIKLHSDPEYAVQSLRAFAAVGDASKLDLVSQSFYDYYPDSIQATLIRADVLRALDRMSESCPLRSTLVKNTPWDLEQLNKYIDCEMDGHLFPDLLSSLKMASKYFPEVDKAVIPEDVNESAKISSRLLTVSTLARSFHIIGNIQSAEELRTYGKALLSRLIEIQQLSPSMVPENQIDYFRNRLDFG